MESSASAFMPQNNEDAVLFESQHVHQVYDTIADHFSDTRHKPWPVVEKFLLALPAGSLGTDVGCGNGKYFQVNSKIYALGNDHSASLLQLAAKNHPQSDFFQADHLTLPFLDNSMDFSISIAVLHHLSTHERRLAAISELLRITKSRGKLLIFVWAFEQQGRRSFEHPDSLVSWKLRPSSNERGELMTLHRYYHLFKQFELDSMIDQVGNNVILESGYDRDNCSKLSVFLSEIGAKVFLHDRSQSIALHFSRTDTTT